MAGKKDETPVGIGGPTDRKTLNVMLGMGILNQVDQTQREFTGTGGQVQGKREYLSKPLRFLSGIGGLFLTVGCLGLILYFLTFLLSGHHGVGLPPPAWGWAWESPSTAECGAWRPIWSGGTGSGAT